LINLLSDACLSVGFELKRKQIDQTLVQQASEDVLGLVKGPFSPGGGGVGAGSNGKKDQTQSQASEAEAQEEAVPATSWPDETPLQAHAAVAGSGPSAPVTIGVASNFSSAATATLVADERRGAKSSPRDGNWTRSTFDVLIDALKQGRAVARE
jgi:hypothetical protein